MKRLLLAVFLFSLPGRIWAQQGQTGGLQFISPMQIATGRDNNFLVDRTDPNEKLFVLSLPPSVQTAAPNIKPQLVDATFFMLRLPKIGYLNESRRHDLTLTYVPELELYRHNSDQNAISQQAVVNFNYLLGRNMQIGLGDTYRSSHDPARTLQNVFLLLPRSPYSDNSFRASFDIQPGRLTSIGVRYDRTYSKFGQTDPFQTRILDTQSTGYTLSVTRMLRRNHRLRAMFSYFRTWPIRRAELNDDAVDIDYAFERPVHSGTLQYKVGLGPGTIVQVAGGAARLDTGVNYILGASLDKRLATFYWLSAGYSRTLTYLTAPATAFAQGLGGNGFYDVAVVRFNGQPSRNTGISLDTTFARGASGRVIESARAFQGRARFDYRLNDRNVLFTSVESFQQNRNAYVQSPLARTRFTVGIEISLSTETQRRTNRLNEDGEYVALTDHGRLREEPQ